ncbi:MAG: M48 family metallopeptidase [Candidatus Accumulibacter sp.]|jgi:Zn-dependent protease with chaperone function|nr:M48 family metallopeptidase [Accumulibacter sp.]
MIEEYSNPEVPHEVNVSEKRPVTDFLRLCAGVVIVVVPLAALVFFGARLFAPKIPFRYEAMLNDSLSEKNGILRSHFSGACAAEEKEGLRSLQSMSDRLAGVMELPEEMKIRVHLSDARDPNAFATLGGNVSVNRGLIENIHTENGLAMVIAHEIAHVRRRDPIVSLGGGVSVALLLSVLIGNADGGSLVAWAAGFTQLSFSREQEAEANAAALSALKARYGYTNGADEFFVHITKKYPRASSLPAFVSTHPTPESRLREIRASFDPVSRKEKPLPDALRRLQLCWKKHPSGL